MNKNPTKLAEKLGFIISEKLDEKYYTGTCKCGTFNVITYYTLNKKKYCWNEDCEFYQRTKLFHEKEVSEIVKSVDCRLKDSPYTTVKKTDDIGFICNECGLEQHITFHNFLLGMKDRKWCNEVLCECYRSPFKLTTSIVKNSIELYGFTLDDDFTYINYDSWFYVTCDYDHRYKTTLRKLKKRRVCEMCLAQ